MCNINLTKDNWYKVIFKCFGLFFIFVLILAGIFKITGYQSDSPSYNEEEIIEKFINGEGFICEKRNRINKRHNTSNSSYIVFVNNKNFNYSGEYFQPLNNSFETNVPVNYCKPLNNYQIIKHNFKTYRYINNKLYIINEENNEQYEYEDIKL
jgi:hypothetical protein